MQVLTRKRLEGEFCFKIHGDFLFCLLTQTFWVELDTCCSPPGWFCGQQHFCSYILSLGMTVTDLLDVDLSVVLADYKRKWIILTHRCHL